jgi:hypothetical protein
MSELPKSSEDTSPSASTFKSPRNPWTIAKRLLLAATLGFGALHLFPAGWDLLYAARADPFVVTGVVDDATGDTKVKTGEQCRILIDPDFKAGFNCRVDVECGGLPLWGGELRGGYADCVTRDRRFVRGHHKDSEESGGHTWLTFDLEKGSLRLNNIQSDVRIRIERSNPADE